MPEAEAVWMHIANLAQDGVDVKIVTETEWLAMENEKRELEEEQRNLKQTPQRSN
jgi:biotin operon repressor